MKIYEEVTINMITGETISEKSYEYEGPIDELKGGGGDSTVTIRYAPDVEAYFKDLMNYCDYYIPDALLKTSPYANYTVIDPDMAFFGVGYTIASFPSLYDMFGKFMAGLDVEYLYNQEQMDTMYGAPIAEAIAAEATYLDDEINLKSLPNIRTGLRDINAVMSSGFMMAEAMVEDTRLKAINKYAADLRIKAMDLGHSRWAKHLEWNQNVISMYHNINSLYFTQKAALDTHNLDIKRAEVLWPFQILDFKRLCTGVLNGAAAGSQQKPGFAQQASEYLGMASAAITLGTQVASMFSGAETAAAIA